MKNTIRKKENTRPSVVIATKLNKVTIRVDAEGNEIDPKTKRVIINNKE